jgi:hypothetical protein
MPLDAENMKAMYDHVFEKLDTEIEIEAIPFIHIIKTNHYNPQKVAKLLRAGIQYDREETIKSGPWIDSRIKKSLPIKKALYEVLFCPFDEVGLHINGMFVEIAKWRLEHAI